MSKFFFVLLVLLSLTMLVVANVTAHEVSVWDPTVQPSLKLPGCNVKVYKHGSRSPAIQGSTDTSGNFKFEGWFAGSGKCSCVDIDVTCSGYPKIRRENIWSCSSGSWFQTNKTFKDERSCLN